jgi:hypothetical protein
LFCCRNIIVVKEESDELMYTILACYEIFLNLYAHDPSLKAKFDLINEMPN